MKEYQLEVKQIANYSRCRIYRSFVQTLLQNKSLRTSGNSHLMHYTVLCCYANFRTSYLRLGGCSYTIRPGEWVCRITDMMAWFRVRFQHQVISILTALEQLHLISFSKLNHDRLIRYRISCWSKHNTVLDYNCPCQKDTGFFFFPVSVTTRLIGHGRVSEMDALLDLWLATVYRDPAVRGSDIGPVVYFRNRCGSPLLSCSDLSNRWGRSRSSVSRLLKKLTDQKYISVLSFPGRCGSVIYLQSYLSTMFKVVDKAVEYAAVAKSLDIKISLPEPEPGGKKEQTSIPICVAEQPLYVPEPYTALIVEEVLKYLAAQGFSCFGCNKMSVKLSPLSVDCKGNVCPPTEASGTLRLKMDISCSKGYIIYQLALTITPLENETWAWRNHNDC